MGVILTDVVHLVQDEDVTVRIGHLHQVIHTIRITTTTQKVQLMNTRQISLMKTRIKVMTPFLRRPLATPRILRTRPQHRKIILANITARRDKLLIQTEMVTALPTARARIQHGATEITMDMNMILGTIEVP